MLTKLGGAVALSALFATSDFVSADTNININLKFLSSNVNRNELGLGDRKADFAAAAMGIARGFGVDVAEECFQDTETFFVEIKEAIGSFENKTAASVAEGLKELGLAVEKFLPAAAKSCHKTETEIKEIMKALAQFANPTDFVYHISKDLIVNHKDIFKSVNTAIADYHAKNWDDFGFSVGTALREVLIGKKQMELNAKNKVLTAAVSKAIEKDLDSTLPNTKEFLEVTLGLAEGFGLSLAGECVSESVGFFTAMKEAIEDFETKEDGHVLNGLKELGEAFLKYLPDAVKACEGTEKEIALIVKALTTFASPESFVYHVGKDLLLNGISIFKDVNGAIKYYKSQDWLNFGRYLGMALNKLIIGLEKQELEAKKMSKLNPTNLDFTDAAHILKGVITGFGITAGEECVKISEETLELLQKVIDDLNNNVNINSVLKELFDIIKKDLPENVIACKDVEEQVKAIVKELAKYSDTPGALIVHIGKDVIMNKEAIDDDVDKAVSQYKIAIAHKKGGSRDRANSDFEVLGQALGDALKLALLGAGDAKQHLAAVGAVNTTVPSTDFAKGLFVGFGATVADECYNVTANIEYRVDAAISDYKNGDITAFVEQISDILMKDIKPASETCADTYDDVVKMVEQLKTKYPSADALIHHFADDAAYHVFSIRGDVDAAIAEHDKEIALRDYELMGNKLGDAMRLVVIGSREKESEESTIFV